MQVDAGALAAGQVEGLPYIGQFYPGVASLPGHGAPAIDNVIMSVVARALAAAATLAQGLSGCVPHSDS